MTQQIFVFGSNLAGIHGAGAAAYARVHHGAHMRVAIGRTGNAYAIPTKDAKIEKTLSLREIRGYVNAFIAYATVHGADTFFVTRIGCGLAGLQDKDIGPMFANAPSNCILPIEWKPFLDEGQQATVQFHSWDADQRRAQRPPSVDHMPDR